MISTLKTTVPGAHGVSKQRTASDPFPPGSPSDVFEKADPRELPNPKLRVPQSPTPSAYPTRVLPVVATPLQELHGNSVLASSDDSRLSTLRDIGGRNPGQLDSGKTLEILGPGWVVQRNNYDAKSYLLGDNKDAFQLLVLSAYGTLRLHSAVPMVSQSKCLVHDISLDYRNRVTHDRFAIQNMF